MLFSTSCQNRNFATAFPALPASFAEYLAVLYVSLPAALAEWLTICPAPNDGTDMHRERTTRAMDFFTFPPCLCVVPALSLSVSFCMPPHLYRILLHKCHKALQMPNSGWVRAVCKGFSGITSRG